MLYLDLVAKLWTTVTNQQSTHTQYVMYIVVDTHNRQKTNRNERLRRDLNVAGTKAETGHTLQVHFLVQSQQISRSCSPFNSFAFTFTVQISRLQEKGLMAFAQ